MQDTLETMEEKKLTNELSAIYTGIPSSPGVALSKAIVVYPPANLQAIPDKPITDVDREVKRFKRALEAARDEVAALGKRLEENLPSEERSLFEGYLQILDSPTFYKEVVTVIAAGQWAEGALRAVIAEHVAQFDAMEDLYLRERGADIRDLGQRILARLQSSEGIVRQYPKKTILIGEEVSASALAEVPEGHLVGVVSTKGSSNSHVAILARALGVPTIMGVESLPVNQLEGKTVLLDAYHGQLYISPTEKMCQEFLVLIKEEEALAQEFERLRELPAETLDGRAVSLFVNTGLATDIRRALRVGAEGVGLYRTEVPFMVRSHMPSETEQNVIYRQLLKAFSPRPVIMRTLDVGGDKTVSYLPFEGDNPFLGWRGIRVSLDKPDIFSAQVRAMLRASEGYKNLHLMLPMITCVEQVDQCRTLIDEAYESVKGQGLDIDFPALGVMIEVPSAVYMIDAIAERVDFLSVGSNDLAQYILAVDRNNPKVANLYDCLHPAVLQALLQVVEGGHRAGKHVSICGEMAGDPAAVILLLAMGFDTLSMNAANLLRMKWVLRNITYERSKRLLSQVLEMDRAENVRTYMEKALEDAGLGSLMRAGA